MRLFQVFHENGNNDIDEDKLRHEYENDEEERSEVWWNTTVPQTVVAFLALFTQSVLHNAVPVVACRDPEQGQEGHPERTEVSMLSQALAGVVLITFWNVRNDVNTPSKALPMPCAFASCL